MPHVKPSGSCRSAQASHNAEETYVELGEGYSGPESGTSKAISHAPSERNRGAVRPKEVDRKWHVLLGSLAILLGPRRVGVPCKTAVDERVEGDSERGGVVVIAFAVGLDTVCG
jgi:hypothetical protein